MGLITNLMVSKVTCVGLGNTYTRPLGYVVIWAQVDGVWGYDEDQIALVILDFSNFVTRVPVILGTPTIGWVINVMREAEMDALAMPWANARAAHSLAVRRMMPVGSRKWPGGWVSYRWRQPINIHPKSRNIGTFFLPCNTCEDNEGIFGRAH